ncbi:MAG: hypothetical protein HY332_04340 [Chloroflexi bacterium]|nr:hypothetical protein [Chloroflexota bacterium]
MQATQDIEARQALIRQIICASTPAEVEAAKRAVIDWMRLYPTDIGMLRAARLLAGSHRATSCGER